jgi:hypothetical protein
MADTQKGHRVTKEFLADLESVFATDASDDISIGDLKDLGEGLEKSRKYCDRTLNQALSKLPAHHPVKCPISLYGAMGMGRLEVAHTRTLAWMLNPNNKEHGFGDALLQSFWRHIRKCGDVPRAGVKNVHVERFHRNMGEDAGRTDIWIEGFWSEPNSAPWLIVIEGKIDSAVDTRQLDRYSKEIDAWRHGHKVSRKDIHKVLLATKDALPEEAGNDWITLSFDELARFFLKTAQSLRYKAGYEFLRLYLAGVLHDILGLPISRADVGRNPYKLLEFLRGIDSTE